MATSLNAFEREEGKQGTRRSREWEEKTEERCRLMCSEDDRMKKIT